MLTAQKTARRTKKRSLTSYGMLAYERILGLGDLYETEDERGWGPGGAVPNPGRELEDYGEEGIRGRKVVERVLRRLGRGERAVTNGGGEEGGMDYPWFNRTRKRKERESSVGGGGREREEGGLRRERGSGKRGRARIGGGKGGRRSNGVSAGEAVATAGGAGAAERARQEGLDDLDLDLLGELRSDEEEGGEEGSEATRTDAEGEGEGEGDETEDEAL